MRKGKMKSESKNEISNVSKVLVEWKLAAKENIPWKYSLGNLLKNTNIL